jgi:hypothetical protein
MKSQILLISPSLRLIYTQASIVLTDAISTGFLKLEVPDMAKAQTHL